MKDVLAKAFEDLGLFTLSSAVRKSTHKFQLKIYTYILLDEIKKGNCVGNKYRIKEIRDSVVLEYKKHFGE